MQSTGDRLVFEVGMLDAIGEAVVALDLDGSLRYANPAAYQMFSLPAVGGQLPYGEDPSWLRWRELVRDYVAAAVRDGRWTAQLDLPRADRTVRPARVTLTPFSDPQGRPAGVMAVAIDVTAEVRSAEALARRTAEQASVARLSGAAITATSLGPLLDSAAESIAAIVHEQDAVIISEVVGDAIIVRAATGRGQHIVDSVVDLADIGYVAEAFRTGEPFTVSSLDTGARFPLRLPPALATTSSLVCVPVVAKGRPIAVISIHSVRPHQFGAGELAFLVAAAHVISAVAGRLATEERIAHDALHDPLTELANRTLFLNRVDHALAVRKRSSDTVAVLFVDLDHFKLVNDSLGHEAGDKLLVAVGRRLRSNMRPGDSVARLGGDEFAVLCDRIDDPRIAVDVAQRLLRAFTEPFKLGDATFYVAASIGIAVPSNGEDAAELLRNADVAMYRAKDQGRSRAMVFDDALRQEAVSRFMLGSELRCAIERDELRLVYQPKVDVGTGRLVAFEALLRWDHPTLGLLAPDRFLHIAEDTGLIVPIGRWVLDTAVRQAAKWALRWPEHQVRVAVNVSATQLTDPTLVHDVSSALLEHRLPAALLGIEITETAAMADPAAAAVVLGRLHDLGCHLAVDDFGTGYSSMAYLQSLPLDALKIDMRFIDGVASNDADRAIVAATITLAHSLGLITIAEGVETSVQEAAIRDLGCDLAQGYLYARPVNAPQAARLIAATKPCGAAATPF